MANRSKRPAFEFDNFGARPIPGKDDTPIWVDYIELLCIFHKDKTITRGEIYDIVFKEGNEITSTITEAEDIKKLLAGDNDENEDDFGNGEELMAIDIALLNDNRSVKITDWFRNASSRSKIYDENYPFTVDTEKYVIKFKSDLNDASKLYLYLLLSGSLRLFSPTLTTKITTDFELLCLKAQSAMFPVATTGIYSETHCLGKNQMYTGNYGSKLSEKLTWLGRAINCDALDISHIPANNKGDRGIDILSFYKFNNDIASGLPLILAQCACSYDEWKKKQADHRQEKFRHFRLVYYEYIRMIFIPFHYRDNNGKWFTLIDLETVVLDRFRIIQCLADELENISDIIQKWVRIFFEDSDNRMVYASNL